MEYTHVTHTFAPVFDENSEILILGSFPSVKSRENQFYYGHPQNRFWKVLARVFHCDMPVTIEEKVSFLHANHVAVWDVINTCDIVGSSDSSIKNVVGNDMDVILDKAKIRKIFVNGDKAYKLFLKYCQREGQPDLVKLPSTSPANAAWSLERLITEWQKEIRN
jgi:hypoxanthine-DNA glycosylase